MQTRQCSTGNTEPTARRSVVFAACELWRGVFLMRSVLIATACLCVASILPAALPARGSVDPASLSETPRALASDSFQGRAPGTRGEQRTIEYLTRRFKEAGLSP